MDRQGQLIALGVALTCLTASVLAQGPITLREVGWLSREGQLEALTSEPRFDRDEVFAAAAQSPLAAQYPTPAHLRADLEVGEALFKTPLVLGGQAAKAGISCHSCHVNGRSNPHFQFPAISGEPGTADVTHSFFSATLGNGVPDSVPIPDLARGGKISHDPGTRDLERFIATIVVGEFTGPEPVPGAIEPLATFVRALRLTSPDAPIVRQPRTATGDLADAHMMVRQARIQLVAGNPALASLLLGGGRDRLSVIHERLVPGEHDAAREALVALSRDLGNLQGRLRRDQAAAEHFDHTLGAWRRVDGAIARLGLSAHKTLYDRELLARNLGQ